MPITVKDIHEKEFSKQVRGYSIEEVDEFLDELASQMEIMIKENREAVAAAEAAKAAAPVVVAEAPKPVVVTHEVSAPSTPLMDEPQYFKNLEITVRETLMNAQRLADETVAEARKKANATIASAEEQAASIVASARAEAEKVSADAQELKQNAEDYRVRFVRLLEEQAHLLKAEDTLFIK